MDGILFLENEIAKDFLELNILVTDCYVIWLKAETLDERRQLLVKFSKIKNKITSISKNIGKLEGLKDGA